METTMNFNFDYRKKFSKKDHLLNFTANYSLGNSDGESYFDQESVMDSLMRHQQNFQRQQPQITLPELGLYLADHAKSYLGSRDQVPVQYQ